MPMGKIAVLSFRTGNFEQGFEEVRLEIKEDNQRLLGTLVGKLPPAPHIPQLYTSWQSKYRQLGTRLRLETPSARLKNFSTRDLEEESNLLKQQLNDWLKSPEFSPVREGLIRNVRQDEAVRVIIETEDMQLWRLPWHLWDFFDNHLYAEPGLSSSQCQVNNTPKTRNKVRILAIVGDSTGIKLESDRRELEKNLPDAEIVFITEPEREEVVEAISDSQGWGWDILFFAGHSLSEPDTTTGKLFTKKGQSIEITELKLTLRRAIAKGLKLAIFNSCDGLGIAKQLADLNIPQVIVMREPIPDVVAQRFLKYFLQAFARGQSLYLAVREARERLESVQSEFPCATWLPVICQNLAEEPVNWQDMLGIGATDSIRVENQNFQAEKADDFVTKQPISILENRGRSLEEETPQTKSLKKLKADKRYKNLIGRDTKINEIRSALNEDSNLIIAIDGIGGVGKTALTVETAIRSLEDGDFDSVIWVSAKPEEFTSEGRFELSAAYIKFESVLNDIATELGYSADISRIKDVQEKRNFVSNLLKHNRYLIIIDNLETVEGYKQLVQDLKGLFYPSRVVLTTRRVIGGFNHVQSFCLKGLEYDDSLIFLRKYASAKSRSHKIISSTDNADLIKVHEVTGGLPLAMELVIGKLESGNCNLERILEKLTSINYKILESPNVSDENIYQEFYRFIYEDSWQELSEDAKKFLIGLSKYDLSEGALRKRIFASQKRRYQLTEEQLENAEEKLIELSLITYEAQNNKFLLHPLTHAFIQEKTH